MNTNSGKWLLLLSAVAAGVALAGIQEDWDDRRTGDTEQENHVARLLVTSGGDFIAAGSRAEPGEDLDYHICSYDENGSVLWEAGLSGAAGGEDRLADLSRNASGELAATGWLSLADPDDSAIGTAAFGAGGDTLWTHTWDQAGKLDEAFDVLLQDDGSVLVAGASADSSHGEAVLLKLDSAGSPLWEYTYDAGPGTLTEALSLVSDGLGGAYLAGWTGTAGDTTGLSHDAWLAHVDNAGGQSWSATWDGGIGPDRLGRLALGAGGSLYAAGLSDQGSLEQLVLKLNSSGVVQWAWTSGGIDDDQILELAARPEGGVVAAGRVVGGSGEELLRLASLNGDGSEAWIVDQSNCAAGEDPTGNPVTDLLVDDNGFIYLAGVICAGDGDWDFHVLKYSPGGVQLWSAYWAGDGEQYDEALALALAEDGRFNVAGAAAWAEDEIGDFTVVSYTQDPPAAVSGLTIVSEESDVQLSWPMAADAGLYTIWRAENADGPWQKVASTEGTAYIDAGIVSPDEERFYYVVSVN